MATMRVAFDHEVRPRGVVQTITVEGGGTEAAVGAPVRIVFPGRRFDPPSVIDGAAFGQILFAMGFEGIDEMRVEGPMSLEAVRNIRAFQEAWVEMLPHKFHLVEVTPDAIVRDLRSPRPRTVAAYSAGLDSTFTAARHTARSLGVASYDLSHVLMIHGLDIPLRNRAGFSALVAQARPALEELGLELIVVRTNILAPNPHSKRFLQPYGYSFGAQIAGVLHGLSAGFGHALLAGGRPYSSLMLPNGSSPVVDHLLSGGALHVVHDGAGYSRTQKAALIAGRPALVKSLRVCFDPPPRNCGRCEKCVRTRLNFMALGLTNPPCFDGPFEEGMIDLLDWRSPTAAMEAQSALDYALRAGVEVSWLDRLRRKITELEATRPADPNDDPLTVGVTRPPRARTRAG